MGFGRVQVPAVWVQVPIWVLAGFESQLRGFESQSEFWLGSSLGRVGSGPIRVLARIESRHVGSSPNLRFTVSLLYCMLDICYESRS